MNNDELGIYAILLLFLIIALYRNRENIRAAAKWFAALNQKTKQLIVLLVIAIFYTCCFFYQLPLYTRAFYAAYYALMDSTPAIAFGGIAFWWLAQAKKDQ